MQGSRTHMGSTMRLGSRRTLLQTPDCITSKLYVIYLHIHPEIEEAHMISASFKLKIHYKSFDRKKKKKERNMPYLSILCGKFVHLPC